MISLTPDGNFKVTSNLRGAPTNIFAIYDYNENTAWWETPDGPVNWGGPEVGLPSDVLRAVEVLLNPEAASKEIQKYHRQAQHAESNCRALLKETAKMRNIVKFLTTIGVSEVVDRARAYTIQRKELRFWRERPTLIGKVKHYEFYEDPYCGDEGCLWQYDLDRKTLKCSDFYELPTEEELLS
jgi:hypothetical protein